MVHVSTLLKDYSFEVTLFIDKKRLDIDVKKGEKTVRKYFFNVEENDGISSDYWDTIEIGGKLYDINLYEVDNIPFWKFSIYGVDSEGQSEVKTDTSNFMTLDSIKIASSSPKAEAIATETKEFVACKEVFSLLIEKSGLYVEPDTIEVLAEVMSKELDTITEILNSTMKNKSKKELSEKIKQFFLNEEIEEVDLKAIKRNFETSTGVEEGAIEIVAVNSTGFVYIPAGEFDEIDGEFEILSKGDLEEILNALDDYKTDIDKTMESCRD